MNNFKIKLETSFQIELSMKTISKHLFYNYYMKVQIWIRSQINCNNLTCEEKLRNELTSDLKLLRKKR